jgi:glycosyltransferase involved in cell wall biosynthesis
MTPQVSVVMATCRRPDLLQRCLDALLNQTLPGEAYEIIVVDDGRTDDTRALVAAMAAGTQGAPTLRYLRPEGTRGPAGARNRGWRASEAPLIAFTDDDTIPDRDWLRQGLIAMDSDDRVASSGRTVVPVEGEPTDHAVVTRGLEAAEFITANAFVRRAALVSIGGFDERFTRPWREDSDLQFSLLREGGWIGHAPEAIVVHPVREAPWGICIGQQKNSLFEALLYKKHPQLYRQKVTPQVPWRYYFIVACTLGAVVALASAAWLLAAALLLPALVAILSFAVLRLKGTSKAPAHIVEMLATSFVIPYLSVYWRLRGAWQYRVAFW